MKLFGGAQIECEARALTGRAAHRRRLALLSLLVCSPTGSLARDKLIAFLWPENDSERARHLLSESLYVLRKELGEDAFVAARDELSLNPKVVSSDVGEFGEALVKGDLRRAVALYRGPFLDGFYVSDAPDFERWAEGERDRLARAYAAALETLAGQSEDAGEFLRAAEWWRRLAMHDPYSSRVALRLMRALDATGERAAAIRHAQIHSAALRDGLGLEPDAEVSLLVQRLRTAAAAAVPPADSGPLLREGERWSEAPPPEEAFQSHDPAELLRMAEAVSPWPGDAEGNGSSRFRKHLLHRVRAHSRPGVYLALAIWLLGLGVGIFLWPAERPRATKKPTFVPSRIAVLYPELDGDDADLGYLANSLTETLIHQLNQVEGLRVVSPNGVKPYRNRAVPPDSIGRVLGVGTLVGMSLQQSRGRLRLAVHLVDANSGEELDSRVAYRSMDDRFALSEDLAAEVADFLRQRLGQEIRLRQWMAGTRSNEAREMLLRANEIRENGLNIVDEADSVAVLTARRMYDVADSVAAQASAQDPRWVEPFVLRARLALDRLQVSGTQEGSAWIQAARKYAAQALALHPGYPPALEIRGTAYWKDANDSLSSSRRAVLVARAEADLRAATTADPALASAWSTLSEVLRFKVNLVEAEFAAKKAYEKDAYQRDLDRVLERLYRISLMREQPAQATEWCNHGRKKFPTDWRFIECGLVILSHPSTENPDPARAWELLRQLNKVDPPEKARLAGRPYNPIYRQVRVAVVLARNGQGERARAILARARREAGADPALYVFLSYDEAYLRLLLGEKEEALKLLQSYIRTRPHLKDYALSDPQFERLWSDPALAARARSW